MDIADYIGFFITILALLFLFFHNRFERKNRYENREELEKAEQELPLPTPLRDFLKALEGDQEHPKKKEPQPQHLRHANQIRPKKRAQKIAEPEHKIDSQPIKRPSSRGLNLLNNLHHPRDMVIYYEIFHKPKGL